MLPPREFERSSGLLCGLKTTTVNGWLTGSYLFQPALGSAACSTALAGFGAPDVCDEQMGHSVRRLRRLFLSSE